MDQNFAKFIMLDVKFPLKVVEEYQLEDLCIWYLENDIVPYEIWRSDRYH